MNSTQAKQLSLPEIMSRLGYQPVKTQKGGREVWYKSPFRAEKDASFVTSYLGGKWIWNDFGDSGGTVIDFVMRHENYTRVKQALIFLERMFQGHLFEKPTSRRVGEIPQKSPPDLFSFKQQGREAAADFSEGGQLEFLEATPIRNLLIYDYLQRERGIPRELAERYLVEVKYRNRGNGREYFAFGMKNESGGYEVRAASSQYSFKSALNGRDVTLIRGKSPERKTVSIFEGMTDFLSLLAMTRSACLLGDSLILHSLSSFPKAAQVIHHEAYHHIYTFLDNDRAGQDGTQRFLQEFPGLVTSYSARFAPYADLNDALMAGQRPDFSIAG